MSEETWEEEYRGRKARRDAAFLGELRGEKCSNRDKGHIALRILDIVRTSPTLRDALLFEIEQKKREEDVRDQDFAQIKTDRRKWNQFYYLDQERERWRQSQLTD